MSTNIYSNIPQQNATSSSDATVRAFDAYYTQPLELSDNVLTAMRGFFTSRGFEKLAAENIAVIIMKQAKKDGYNPMNILDTLGKLDTVEISAIVSEILNYNRVKTSFLGYARQFTPNAEVQRNIVDVSFLPKTFSVVPSVDTITEGDSVTFIINTTDVSDGTLLYWELIGTGITINDFDNPISGTVVINNGTASVTITATIDGIIDNNETAVFNLRKKSPVGPVVASTSIIIDSTSIVAISDYIVIEYTFLTGSDLDTRTRIVSPIIGSYVGYGWPVLNPTILQWSGDNTGTGTESALFNIINFKTDYPGINEIMIDCRALWYSTIGTDPVGLKVSLYLGGTMVKSGFNWINPTATSVTTLDVNLKTITLKTTDSSNIGERIAFFYYNLNTGVGLLDSDISNILYDQSGAAVTNEYGEILTTE